MRGQVKMGNSLKEQTIIFQNGVAALDGLVIMKTDIVVVDETTPPTQLPTCKAS